MCPDKLPKEIKDLIVKEAVIPTMAEKIAAEKEIWGAQGAWPCEQREEYHGARDKVGVV